MYWCMCRTWRSINSQILSVIPDHSQSDDRDDDCLSSQTGVPRPSNVTEAIKFHPSSALSPYLVAELSCIFKPFWAYSITVAVGLKDTM